MSDGEPQDAGSDEQNELGLDIRGGERASSAPNSLTPYRVLARKYRPSGFADLVGQEAMVRTLTNAFHLGRIHQAYMLTGVRGVGKTTTARILARAFNYELPARNGRPAINQPTIDMPQLGVHCEAIIESRHIDVIEMDAASNTGVDDVREIIENARFRPVSARIKVYIVDEVHMLSKAAFNALLKTLEEPPEHVKFLFATTEIEKVPVTVRSRCQRFDLRRVDAEILTGHLASICEKEAVNVEPDALTLIARAAEGSVRDALSLLDQAIAHGASASGAISAETVNMMLGLADRGQIIDLFELVMKGDAAAALAAFKELYDRGADPGQTLVELAELTHYVTGVKLAPAMASTAASPEERRRGGVLAQSLSLAWLTRAWQILAKGVQDVKDSPRPQAAADMVLVRLAYAADLPTPDDVLRRLTDGSRPNSAPSARTSEAPPAPPPVKLSLAASSPRPTPAPSPTPIEAPAAPQRRLLRFEDVVALAQAERDVRLKSALERDVRLVSFAEGSIEFALAPGASPQLVQTLARRLQDWTGMRWIVAVSSESGAPSLREQAEQREEERRVGVRSDPLVRAVLETFPGAEIVSVHAPEAAPTSGRGDEELSEYSAEPDGAEAADSA
jgi:DNA polymerase III subunit gamma/tau